MKTKLIATAVAAVLMAGSHLALADGWKHGKRDSHGFQPRHERGWSGHAPRVVPPHRLHHRHHYRAPVRAWGHAKPHWHQHYRPRYHSHWKPHSYYRGDGITIILRGRL